MNAIIRRGPSAARLLFLGCLAVLWLGGPGCAQTGSAHAIDVSSGDVENSARQDADTGSPAAAPEPAGAADAPAADDQSTSDTGEKPSDSTEPAPTTRQKKKRSAADLADAIIGDEGDAAAVIRSDFSRIPQDLKKRRVMSMREVKQIADRTLLNCYHYLKNFPRGEHRHEVLYAAAKLLTMNHQRYKEGPPMWAKPDKASYFKRIGELIEEGRALEIDQEYRFKFDRVEGQILYFERRWKDAVEHYRQMLERYPMASDRDEVWFSYIKCSENLFSNLARTQQPGVDKYRQQVIDECKKLIEAHPGSMMQPHVISLLAKVTAESGHPDVALAIWERFAPLIRAGAAGRKTEFEGRQYRFDKTQKGDYRTYLEQLDFWLGFNHYVLGNLLEARAHFQAHLDIIDGLEQSRRVGQVGKVFKTRTMRLLEILSEHQGNEGASLDEIVWQEGQRLDLQEARGKVVALFFATTGNERYHPFARALQEFSEEEREDFRAAWIAYPKSKKAEPRVQLAPFRNEAYELGVRYSIGLDNKGWPLHKAYNVPVGGGNLVVLDREGKVAWFKMDPTLRDIEIARFVFHRLMAQGQ